jgi:hypothetical protein
MDEPTQTSTQDSGVAKDFPPLPDMIRIFSHDMMGWAKDGFKTADEGETNRRLAICESCENYKEERCVLCGCFMKAKAKVLVASCPSAKW